MKISDGKLGIRKRVLLGAAAGLVAIVGAHAADAPLKKSVPVKYVQICDLYGDGFSFIPGSQTCLKLGGYIRADVGQNVKGGRNPLYSGADGSQDRTVSTYSTRQRANIQLDTRSQTNFGALRTLTSIHFQNQDGGDAFNVARAFVQWGGFTAGHTRAFSDTWGIEASWHPATQQNHSDTGANGVNVFGYTAEIGDGKTLNFGVEERRTKSLTNLSSSTALKIGAEGANSFGGENWPDPSVMFRIDQAWGYWSAAVAAHDVNASYYSAAGTGPFTGTVAAACSVSPASTQCGHPQDRIGYAIMQGGEVRLPFFAEGDRAGYFFHYGQGAAGFTGGGSLAVPDLFASGNNVALGWLTDGVFVNGSGIELTRVWTIGSAIEHYWKPGVLRSDLTGAYTNVNASPLAKGYFSDVGGCTPGSGPLSHGAAK